MDKKLFLTPLILTSANGGNVSGGGSSQGSLGPEGMTYDEWWEEVAWGGENPDADYNGDGVVNQADWEYYIENELWKG